MATPIIYHRLNTAQHVLNSVIVPSPTYDVCVLPRGATVNGNQVAVSTINVLSGHAFVSGNKLMKFNDESTFRTVLTTTETTITITTGTLTVNDDDKLVNLGNDSGVVAPNYDSTTIAIYASQDTTSALSPSKRTTAASGQYEYWTTEPIVWELILDSNDDPDTLAMDIELDRTQQVIDIRELLFAPAVANASDRVRLYMKGDKIIFLFNDALTTRYKYLDLTGTGVTWQHSLTEP